MQFQLRKRGTATGQEPRAGGRASQKGAVQVEFAFVALTLFLVVFGIVEMERMLCVYTTLSNCTRAATRYAIVHGSDRTGTGVNGPSSSGAHTNVDATATNLASAGLLDTSRLTVTVTYTPDNKIGSTVKVQAVYAYDPFTALPLSVSLSSVSQGVITF